MDTALLKRTYAKVKTALVQVSKEESNPDILVDWLLSCSDVKILLGAAASHIKALSADPASSGDLTVLKRTYTRTKKAFETISKEKDLQAEAEWMFSGSEVKLLLTAAAAQIKASMPERSTSQLSLQPIGTDEIIVCGDEDDAEPSCAQDAGHVAGRILKFSIWNLFCCRLRMLHWSDRS